MRGNGFGSTIGHDTIFDRALNKPVAFSTAQSTVRNTSGTQVVIAVLTDTTVEVFIGNRATAVIAINAEHPTRGVVRDNWEAKCVVLHLEVAVVRLACVRKFLSSVHSSR